MQPWVFDGEQLKKCPVKLIDSAVINYIKLFHYFEKGFLPCSGNIQDQPAKLLDFFDTIEEALNEIRKEEEKNARTHSRPV